MHDNWNEGISVSPQQVSRRVSEQYFTQKLVITFPFFVSVSTATYLAAYIVDLILVLYEISKVVAVDPPKRVSSDFVMDALALYKSRSSRIHDQLKEAAYTLKLEKKIASVIRNEAGFTT
jgi:predicted nucleotidyltransferase